VIFKKTFYFFLKKLEISTKKTQYYLIPSIATQHMIKSSPKSLRLITASTIQLYNFASTADLIAIRELANYYSRKAVKTDTYHHKKPWHRQTTSWCLACRTSGSAHQLYHTLVSIIIVQLRGERKERNWSTHHNHWPKYASSQ
jgi:hypothetical protein